LELADAALYSSKGRGKDTIVMGGPEKKDN